MACQKLLKLMPKKYFSDFSFYIVSLGSILSSMRKMRIFRRRLYERDPVPAMECLWLWLSKK